MSDGVVIPLTDPRDGTDAIASVTQVPMHPTAHAPPEVDFSPGQRVIVHSLKKNPEMNGRTGRFLQWVEDDPGWCIVHFDDGEGNQLRATNLALCNDRGIPTDVAEFTPIRDKEDDHVCHCAQPEEKPGNEWANRPLRAVG